jgi:diguanylate cyclase (GGDEF)-like protein/PAS domain S-box-containing protein
MAERDRAERDQELPIDASTLYQRREWAAQARQARLETFFDQATDLIQITDPAGQVLLTNRRWRETLGYSERESRGLTLHEIVHPDSRIAYLAMNALALTNAATTAFATIFVARDGTCLPLTGTLLGQVEVRREAAVWGLFRPGPAYLDSLARLAYQASHDPLTALPNRALFLDRLDQALAQAVQSQATAAVLFLDLDGFKAVNDRLGHEAGDQLLVAVAARLRRCMRPADTAARFGGDEFTILLERITGVRDAIQIAERLLAAFVAPIIVGGEAIAITASMGIACSVAGQDRAALLRAADRAMYDAKSQGKARYAIFESTMNIHVT